MAKRKKAQQDKTTSVRAELNQETLLPKSKKMTLADIMHMDVLAGTAEQSIGDAAKQMAQRRVSCIVVRKDEDVIGIVTEKDFVTKVVAQTLDVNNATLGNVMTTPVLTAEADTSVIDAGHMLSEKRVKRLPVVKNGKLAGIVTQTDVFSAARGLLEEERKQRSELSEAAEKANEIAREAVFADLSKSQFLANMSHEIRTPLNAIIGLSEVLAEERLSAEQKNHLDIIHDSAQNMLVLMNDILDFSKIEAGKFHIQIDECSLEHLLAVVESLMRPQAMNKNLDFGIFHRSELPALIKTDSLRLRQCIINLINNAIKFTESGHVYLNVAAEKVDGQDCLRFDIEDTGIGIAPQDREKIFEQFAQVDDVQSRAGKGSGLGLTITKRLVGLLGGNVSVTSGPKAGSIFSIVIPAGVDVTAQPQITNCQHAKGEEKSSQAEHAPLQGHVLVAEDTPTNQTLIKLLLTKRGLEVTIANDGREAVNDALAGKFDLILMDIQMPNMNGYDATRELRKQGIKTPIVAVTAHAMAGDKEKCLAAGCDDYVAKPIRREKFYQAIEKYLAGKTEELADQVEAVTEQVDELTELCTEKPAETSNLNDEGILPADQLIDFGALMDICMDEDVAKEVVAMFLKDSPKAIKTLAEAMKYANPKHIKMYAHSLKGASLQIGAKKLGDLTFQLECAGREKKMDEVPVLFNHVQDEYGKLTLFLSQDNWFELAKAQHSQTGAA